MESSQNQFNAADFFFGMDINRHSATIINNFKRTIFIYDNLNVAGMTGNGFIHAVINGFLSQMVGACGVGIHTQGDDLTGIKSAEDFDGFCGIGGFWHMYSIHLIV